ncbi:MAG: hypothetical protein PHD40_01790, partial [Syntrophomonadaceae bacterium]|nr:hypothetical protein [Syntrophomonadaceae bacterium]
GSGSLLPPGRHIPARKMAMGNPAVVVKDMTDNMLVYTEIATQLYQDLAIRCRNGLKLIEE